MKSLHEMKPLQRWALNLLARAKILPFFVPIAQDSYGVQRPEPILTYEQCYALFGIVFAGVSAIAKAGAMVPLVWYEIPRGKTAKEKVPLSDDDPLCQLWQNINPIDTAYDIHEELWSYRTLVGDYFLCGESSGPGIPQELWGMRPSRVRIKIAKTEDSKRFIDGYTYANDTGGVYTMKASDVIHVKRFSAISRFYGQGAIGPIFEELGFDRDMMKYNRKLIKNMGVPYGGWETEMLLEAAEVERLKSELDKEFGSTQTGKPSFTHGGLKWKDHGMTLKDLQWPLAMKTIRGRALTGIGVPPVLMGAAEDVNTFATALVQERVFWRITVIPDQTKTAATFTQWARQHGRPNVVAAYDYSDVEALREDQVEKAKLFQIGYQCTSVRPDEYRTHVLKLEPIGGEAAKLWTALGPVEGTDKNMKPRSKPDGHSARQRLIESEARADVWRKFAAELVPWEKKWTTAMQGYFDELNSKLLKALDRGRAHERQEWELVEEVLDDPQELENLKRIGTTLTTEVYDARGKKALATLGLDMDFNVTNPEVKKWIEAKVLKFAQEVSDTTKGKLKAALAKATDEGLPIADTAKIVQSIMDIRRGAATNIARTETISAANAGQREAWKQSGVVESREWLSSRDTLVRDSHAEVDGEVVGFDEPYSNGLMFPGDPTGVPAEICQCRCTEMAFVNEKALKEAKHRLVMSRIERRVYPGGEGSKRCLQTVS